MGTNNEDYFLYVDDGVPGRELAPLRLRDIAADGVWRKVAVDVSGITEALEEVENALRLPEAAAATLLNTRRRTVRGPVLRLPHVPSARYHDAWHRRPAEVIRDGEWDLVSTELGPHGAGCIVVDSAGRTP